MVYPVFRRGVGSRLIPAGNAGRLVFHLAGGEAGPSAAGFGGGGSRPMAGPSLIGFQTWFGDHIAGRGSGLSGFHTIVIRARSIGTLPVKAKLAIITKDAAAFAGELTLSPDFRDMEIPLGSLQKDSMLLLPRPYPDFLPLWFHTAGQQVFSLFDAERLQVTIDPGSSGAAAAAGTATPAAGPGAAAAAPGAGTYGIEVESIWLKK
jgi:hypothetical protein